MPLILPYKNILPKIAKTAMLAPNSVIAGDVEIGEGSAIWFFTVARGDVASIKIGANSNIQDNCVVHVTRANHIANKTGNEPANTIIGNNVTVGHSCILHACTIEDNSFIGMQSVVMDLSTVKTNGMLAAGSLLTAGKTVNEGELWGGRPAKFMRMLTQEEIIFIQKSADNYQILAQEYNWEK